MSKKRRHKNERKEMTSKQNLNAQQNRSPFGINPMQLVSMLGGGNMDMGQLGNMLSSLKMDGLDLNNINLGSNAINQGNNSNPANDFGLGSLQNMMKNLGMVEQVNQTPNNEKDNKGRNNLNIEDEEVFGFEDSDENLRLLESIKKIVDPSKIDFIDRIIEAYESGIIK